MEVTSTLAASVLTDCETSIGNLLPYNGPRASIVPIPNKKPGKLDDIRFNGWLDAMKSSSPTSRRLFIQDSSAETTSEDLDLAYRAWTLQHPSALKSFQQMVEQARKKRIVVFLDYDGTLSPIVDEPDHAILSKEMHLAVKNVAKHFPTAIISGRSRDQVCELVGLTELYYAGSHGMDIMVPTFDRQLNQENEPTLFQPAKEFLPMIDEVYRTLVEKMESVKGAMVENHKFCASVHYRNVNAKEWATIAQSVHDILNNYPDLRIAHGRKVLEVRPAIDWNKGNAVEFLLNSLGSVNGDAHILPIYIGDDRTDEDAFKILRDKGCGYGILVSAVPKETKAFYSLRNTSEVMEFLKLLVSWKKTMEKF